jgi:hypothetical protein
MLGSNYYGLMYVLVMKNNLFPRYGNEWLLKEIKRKYEVS